MIISLSGHIGSGKSTVAQMLKQIDERIQLRSFSENVKKVARLLAPRYDVYSAEGKIQFMPEWGMTVRQFLQKIGTDCMRDHLHQDTWIISLMAHYRPHDMWVIDDTRFMNEVEAIQARNGFLVYIVGDPKNLFSSLSPAEQEHPSETELANLPNKFWDLILYNVGDMSQLRREVETFYHNLLYAPPAQFLEDTITDSPYGG